MQINEITPNGDYYSNHARRDGPFIIYGSDGVAELYVMANGRIIAIKANGTIEKSKDKVQHPIEVSNQLRELNS